MSLRREYIIGMTLCRLFLPVYVWGCPNNIAAIPTSRKLSRCFVSSSYLFLEADNFFFLYFQVGFMF